MISSPCVKKCLVDINYQVCMGCGRFLTEIEVWEDMAEVDRIGIMKRLVSRLEYYKNKKVERGTFDLTRLLQP